MLVIPVSAQDLPYALQIARELRAAGRLTELDVSGHGVGAGLKQAVKKAITLAAIVGEDERRTDTVTLHNLVSGAERQIPRARLAQGFAKEEK